jgi:hypothetical protein
LKFWFCFLHLYSSGLLICSFNCKVFVYFWFLINAGFKEWVEKCPFYFNFLKDFAYNLCYFLFKCLVVFKGRFWTIIHFFSNIYSATESIYIFSGVSIFFFNLIKTGHFIWVIKFISIKLLKTLDFYFFNICGIWSAVIFEIWSFVSVVFPIPLPLLLLKVYEFLLGDSFWLHWLYSLFHCVLFQLLSL